MTGDRERGADHRKRQRGKNLALLAVLAGFVVLVYIVSLVKMGGS